VQQLLLAFPLPLQTHPAGRENHSQHHPASQSTDPIDHHAETIYKAAAGIPLDLQFQGCTRRSFSLGNSAVQLPVTIPIQPLFLPFEPTRTYSKCIK
jgi:hypothetical protein